MSVMTTVLEGTGRPVIRRPQRVLRPATAAFPKPAAVPAVVKKASAVVPAVATVEQAVVNRWQTVTPTLGERAWGVLAHFSGAFLSVAGPLWVARSAGRHSEYVREQALAAANFQLAFLAVLLPFGLIGVVTLGLAALFVVPLVLAWLLTTVLAAFAAAGGERYRYPVALHALR